MSEREEYTPSTAEVRSNMALGVAVAQACADDGHPELPADINWPTGSVRPAAKRQFDAWLAAHDCELREQIARDIEQHYIGPDCDRNPATGADSPHAAEHRAFDDGLEAAARIAREEDQ